jgi:hypothetical protein
MIRASGQRFVPDGDGGGTYVDFASVVLEHDFTPLDEEGVAIPGSQCSATSCPNTTVAESYYRIAQCEEAGCTDLPSGYNARTANQGIDTDRRKSDGEFEELTNVYLAPNNGMGPFVLQEGTLMHPYSSPQERSEWVPGVYLFEAFTCLVDLTKRGGAWSINSNADILAISKVVYTNITVLKGVSPPIFYPPQDFFSANIDVGLPSLTDGSHVLYTLQPPFIYDTNGTWCPHMGEWCSEFPNGQTFHAVPNQPPNFWFSRRGLFAQLAGIPLTAIWNYSAPPLSFPFLDDLGVAAFTVLFNSTGGVGATPL